MELLIMLLLVGAVTVLIVGPLVRPARVSPRDPSTRRRSLRAGHQSAQLADHEKESALAAIRELEFDYATGKLSEDDYASLRTRYEARAVEVLSRPARPAVAADVDTQIEAEIAAARKRARCASCGQPLPQAARFCPACGTAAPEVTR